MDALLRQTARNGEAVSADSNQAHLDADEISAFAENALPERAKQFYKIHFADCDRCRKILSNVILLNAETASETVHAPETEKIAMVLSWHRRLFAAPVLASALGAFVFIFAGLIVLTYLQSTKSSQNAEVSQSREVPINMQGASGEGETQTVESSAAASNSASTMSNYPATTNSAATNSVIRNRSNDSTSNRSTNSNSTTPANKQIDAPSKTLNNSPSSEDKNASVKNDSADNQASGASVAEQKKETENDVAQTSLQQQLPSLRSSPPAPKPVSKAKSSDAADDSKLNRARKMDGENSEIRQIGGKTFRRSGNVWYDTSYSGQSTTSIARGSNEYQKLDAGLRSIAGALSGTVVVVYNGKAYRVQ